jgi:hypothetical protein
MALRRAGLVGRPSGCRAAQLLGGEVTAVRAAGQQPRAVAAGGGARLAGGVVAQLQRQRAERQWQLDRFGSEVGADAVVVGGDVVAAQRGDAGQRLAEQQHERAGEPQAWVERVGGDQAPQRGQALRVIDRGPLRVGGGPADLEAAADGAAVEPGDEAVDGVAGAGAVGQPALEQVLAQVGERQVAGVQPGGEQDGLADLGAGVLDRRRLDRPVRGGAGQVRGDLPLPNARTFARSGPSASSSSACGSQRAKRALASSRQSRTPC